jgi:hypothetical protein
MLCVPVQIILYLLLLVFHKFLELNTSFTYRMNSVVCDLPNSHERFDCCFNVAYKPKVRSDWVVSRIEGCLNVR